MQKNDLALKRRLLFDGEEKTGLVSTSALKSADGLIEAPGFDFKADIKDGTKKFDPLTVLYKVQRNSDVIDFFDDWHNLNQTKDVTIINVDGTGEEIDRWLWRDCECHSFDAREYDAANVTFYGIEAILNPTAKPVRLPAA